MKNSIVFWQKNDFIMTVITVFYVEYLKTADNCTYLVAAFPPRVLDSLDTTLILCFHQGLDAVLSAIYAPITIGSLNCMVIRI